MLSKRLTELGMQLSRNQSTLQDVSTTLRILSDDMLLLHDKLSATDHMNGFVPELHVPSYMIRGKTFDQAKADFAEQTLPDFVKVNWEGNVLKILIDMYSQSEVHVRFVETDSLPPAPEAPPNPATAAAGDGAPALEPPVAATYGLECAELFLNVAALHMPFFEKAKASIMGLLQAEPLIRS